MELYNADCLEKMKELENNSIDLIFCDLPYGQTSCKWDCKINLQEFWKQVMRIKKLNTPIFFTTTTKFGVELITSAPKKCHFRYDIVWCKSAPAGFLSAKKMPLRKHEMIYVFYEKLPFYDLSSHKHKFLKAKPEPEPEEIDEKYKNKGGLYSKVSRNGLVKNEPHYEPPLPVSVVKEEPEPEPVSVVKNNNRGKNYYPDLKQTAYQDPLLVMGKEWKKKQGGVKVYDPPLPVSVVKEIKQNKYNHNPEQIYNAEYLEKKIDYEGRNGGSMYNPPLPNSMLEIKSTRGKHSTEKPVALMEWILKYYSREGDTILDPTCGSGSTGVACKNMNRKFIGIEMDEDIFKIATERLN
jgi:DNA modification methylase